MALRKCRSLMAIVALVALLVRAGINDVAAQSSLVCSSPSPDLTPCLNIITGSSNGKPTGNPSKECCGAVRTIADGGVGCFCQLVSTSNPIGLINRALNINIPGLCKVKTQPLSQCEGNAGVPFTAPTASPGSIPAPAPDEDIAPAPDEEIAPSPDASSSSASSPSAGLPAKTIPSKISPSTDFSPTSSPIQPGSSGNLSPASSPIQPGSSGNLSPTNLPVHPASGVDVNGAYRNGGVYLPSIVGSFAGLILASVV